MRAIEIFQYYNTDIPFPKGSFIAFIHYNFDAKELHVTFRKEGRAYKYTGFSNGKFHQIILAQNRGSYMCHNVVRRYPAEYVGICPQADIDRICNTKFNDFLSK